jgi:broad specificity phosphatase PhoE/predicted kinase
MRAHAPDPQKLVLVMVGLPARGKTYVARKLARYLAWLGYRTQGFNVGDYRRQLAGARQPASFFAPDNSESRGVRLQAAMTALDDLLEWLGAGGQIGIYDATNHERERREVIHKKCTQAGAQVVFIESICEDESVVEANVRVNKLRSPDYVDTDPEEAIRDFRERIYQYERTYEPLDDDDKSYVKLIDVGRQVVVNRVEGYLNAKVVFFLINIHPAQRRVWLTRHGETPFNLEGRIGGDPELGARGRAYAQSLATFMQRQTDADKLVVWTSTLQRALLTASALPQRKVNWRALDEIDAGVCDGMTYAEIKDRLPDEYATRSADKFRYRYPRGESYADVIQRLEPIIVELERQRNPVLVIGHQAVLRALYGYLMGKPQEDCPHLKIPLHSVIQLTPTAYGYDEQHFDLEPRVDGLAAAAH